MRALVIILWIALAAGCSPTGTIYADQQDAAPIKLPPESKPGGDTAPGCNGVPASGRCEGGTAMYCDVAKEDLRQVDCRALGQECVVDPSKGAICQQVTSNGADPNQPCGGAVDAKGYCAADGTALWCDVDNNQIVSWNCGQNGLTCGVDACQSGAYCCANPETPPQPTECDTLGFYGECAGDTARYCSNDTLIERDCAAQGKVCALDECATGAYCCTPPESPVNECAELGVYGECGGAGGNTVRYCIGDTVYENPCNTGAGFTCQLDICFSGAECCTQADYDTQCQAIGYYGTCTGQDNNVAMWCDTGENIRVDCTAINQTCAIDQCATGAACCDPI
jgi:hypothetical protein